MNATDYKITWINHASFLLEFGNVKLVSDPWMEGRVFNKSWDLLSETKFQYDDFKNVTHIWFSHEHPDHFFPPNINKIPEAYRKNITVLYQLTDDKKVVDFCRKKGFKNVIELNPFEKYQIEENFFITNASVSNDTDSWLLLEVGGKVILNLNDCIINEDSELTKIRGLYKKLDVLLTQFSYANWVGNSNQPEKKKASADKKKEQMLRYARFCEPAQVIPFASFVWFCAEDNFHLNEQANGINDIYHFLIENNYEPIVLYPGDSWSIGNKHDSLSAIERYTIDAQNIPNREKTKFEKISIDELKLSAIKYAERLKAINNTFRLNAYKPMNIYLKDHDAVYTFSFRNALSQNSTLTKDYADIIMSSQNLKFCFDFEWAYDSIQVAGTYEKTEHGNFKNYEEYHWVSTLNNKGGKIHGVFKALLKKLIPTN